MEHVVLAENNHFHTSDYKKHTFKYHKVIYKTVTLLSAHKCKYSLQT